MIAFRGVFKVRKLVFSHAAANPQDPAFGEPCLKKRVGEKPLLEDPTKHSSSSATPTELDLVRVGARLAYVGNAGQGGLPTQTSADKSDL